MPNHRAEIVIVTYLPDFDNTVRLVRDIRQQNYLYKDITIHVVVNDIESNLRLFEHLVDGLDVQTYPASEFGIYAEQGRGWVMQQYIKLAVSDRICSPWYLIFDGDQSLWNIGRSVEEQDWFVDQRAYCKVTDLSEYQRNRSPLMKRFQESAELLGMDLLQVEYLLNDKPPVMMHTETVRKLLDEVGDTPLRSGRVTEFSLYWLYLVQQGLDQVLYQTLTQDHFNKICVVMENRKI